MINKALVKTLSVIFAFAASCAAYANVHGIAVITGCMPFGGVTGYCQVTKDFADPFNWHSKQCELRADGQYVNGGSYLSDAHGINNAVTHSWPTGELSTSFEECVEFKILNYSAWWKGHPYTYGPPVLVYDDDTAGGPNHPSCN